LQLQLLAHQLRKREQEIGETFRVGGVLHAQDDAAAVPVDVLQAAREFATVREASGGAPAFLARHGLEQLEIDTATQDARAKGGLAGARRERRFDRRTPGFVEEDDVPGRAQHGARFLVHRARRCEIHRAGRHAVRQTALLLQRQGDAAGEAGADGVQEIERFTFDDRLDLGRERSDTSCGHGRSRRFYEVRFQACGVRCVFETADGVQDTRRRFGGWDQFDLVRLDTVARHSARDVFGQSAISGAANATVEQEADHDHHHQSQPPRSGASMSGTLQSWSTKKNRLSGTALVADAAPNHVTRLQSSVT
jgi:hypothetical protein